MLVKLIEITKSLSGDFSLHTIFVNPKHVVTLREDRSTKQSLMEGKIKLNLNPQAEFTRLTLAESGNVTELTIIGSPSEVQTKFFKQQKTLLRG